jgi:hypothetical protein
MTMANKQERPPRKRTTTARRSEISNWVDKALAHANMKQSDLSRALVQSGLTSVDRAAVSKVIKGQRSLKAVEMLQISRITGYLAPGQKTEGGSTDHPSWPAFAEALRQQLKKSPSENN